MVFWAIAVSFSEMIPYIWWISSVYIQTYFHGSDDKFPHKNISPFSMECKLMEFMNCVSFISFICIIHWGYNIE